MITKIKEVRLNINATVCGKVGQRFTSVNFPLELDSDLECIRAGGFPKTLIPISNVASMMIDDGIVEKNEVKETQEEIKEEAHEENTDRAQIKKLGRPRKS